MRKRFPTGREFAIVLLSENRKGAAMPDNPPDTSLSTTQRQALEKIERQFDEQLAVFQQPNFREKIDAAMNARGHLKNRPKAGTTY